MSCRIKIEHDVNGLKFHSMEIHALYLANASQSSTLVGQHSTALPSRIRASSGFSNSTADFHSRTEFGMCSKAFRKTFFLALVSTSRSAARAQILTEVGMCLTACAMILFETSGGCKRAASSHRSSEFGFTSHPFMIKFLAA